jgi:hypothetical protein
MNTDRHYDQVKINIFFEENFYIHGEPTTFLISQWLIYYFKWAKFNETKLPKVEWSVGYY